MILDINSPEYIFTCTRCKRQLPNYKFHRKNEIRRKRKYFARCKECEGVRVHEWQRTSIKRKDYMLRRQFGITIEDYDSMRMAQDNVCAICGEAERNKFWELAVDHCHKTGKVRGLLCSRCNMAIGAFKDSTDLLERAKNYLIKTNSYLSADN